MDQDGSIDKVNNYLIIEKELVELENNTSLREKLDTLRAKFHSNIIETGSAKDIDRIVDVELLILKNERKHYGNSATMNSSLNAAIVEMKQCLHMLNVVRDPVRYEELNRNHGLPKSRKGLLPNDDARKAFRSHATRLTNLDRSRLTDAEKKIITARHRNITVAEKQYVALQNKALGLDSASKDRSADLSL